MRCLNIFKDPSGKEWCEVVSESEEDALDDIVEFTSRGHEYIATYTSGNTYTPEEIAEHIRQTKENREARIRHEKSFTQPY